MINLSLLTVSKIINKYSKFIFTYVVFFRTNLYQQRLLVIGRWGHSKTTLTRVGG
jgi:hypothetical protein